MFTVPFWYCVDFCDFCRLVLCALRLSSLDPHFTDLCLWILTRVRPFPSPSLFVLVCLSHFTHFPFSLSNSLSFSLYLFIVCSSFVLRVLQLFLVFSLFVLEFFQKHSQTQKAIPPSKHYGQQTNTIFW